MQLTSLPDQSLETGQITIGINQKEAHAGTSYFLYHSKLTLLVSPFVRTTIFISHRDLLEAQVGVLLRDKHPKI
jgi:hypothetical protein